jgi:hypothetical protein
MDELWQSVMNVVQYAPEGGLMADSIVVIRMTRNLRYKLTYVHIFETYLESKPRPEITELLETLIEAQQAAIAPLSRYLRHLDVQTQDVQLDQKLLGHAFSRQDIKSRLRFIHDGLRRATSWYGTQLMDGQMTADPELRELLFELGEIDAAKLWRTEATMGLLRIPTTLKEKEWEDEPRRPDPEVEEGWRPRLVEDVRRPDWTGHDPSRWPRPSKYRGDDS